LSSIRVGLIGVGRIGTLHAQTLTNNADVAEVVVADVDEARAQAVATRFGASFGSLDELFGGRVDALVVAASTTAHAELVRRAARARLTVFCEKPLASDVPSTRAVLADAEAAATSLVMGFQRRSDAGYRAARDAVRSGRLGRLHSLYATTFDATPPPASYIPVSGGIFRDMHIHDFDIIRFVTGREVISVFATGTNNGDAFFAEAGDVDTSAALLTLDDGTIALVQGGRYNGAGHDVRLEVHGSTGTIAVGLDERVPLRSAEPNATWPPATPYGNFLERFKAAYITELDNFIAHVLGRIENPSPGRDALEALYIAEAAELSRARSRPVDVAELRLMQAPRT